MSIGGAAYWYRPLMFGLTAVLLALAIVELASTAASPWGQGLIASDVTKGYLVGAQRFLDTGTPYSPHQLAGPWALDYHSFIHPPTALILFVPFLVLPLPIWWVLPLGLTIWCVYRLQPAPWAWPLMAACLIWPRSIGSLLAGNTDMWVMAFVASGAVWGWPVAGIAIKPTFAPLAVVAIRRRSAWIAGALTVAFIVLTLPAWRDWISVVGNAGLAPEYSLLNLPLALLPVFALSGQRPRALSASPPGR